MLRLPTLPLSLLLLCARPAAAALPLFSWSTVPVFWHAYNATGSLAAPFNDAVLAFVSSHNFASATVEKAQGLSGSDGAGSFAEKRIAAALQQLKAAAAAAGRALATVAYFNSVLNWPYYRLASELQRNPSFALVNDSGAPVRIRGDPHFPQPSDGMLVFDFSQPAVRTWFAGACAALVASSSLDGCFQDRAGHEAFPGVRNTSAYDAGHDAVLVAMQALLPDGFVVANGHVPAGASGAPGVRATMIEFFAADEASITALRAAAAAGLLVQAHAYSAACAQAGTLQSLLAAFLIGAGNGSFFACSEGWAVDPRWPAPGASDDWMLWPADFDKPLGPPCGDAVKTADRYTRAFGNACQTHVAFNTTSNSGSIEWGT
jgi:hypothetical protein